MMGRMGALGLGVLLLAGCQVPLKPYRLTQPAIVVPPVEGEAAVARRAEEKPCVNAETPICLTFIEVDDMGEPYAAGELHTTLAVIRRANRLASEHPGTGDPIVIVFVHGWKNNAAEDNGNVAGFKVALQEVYRSFQGKKRVIGVYIGWRGNLIRKSWPVAQQTSYFNREATATRIPGATLATALAQIAARTHENQRALAVFIGHSFGGLLLERTVTEATASQIAQATIYTQEANALPARSPEAEEKRRLAEAVTDARADLVIFINPAGAATEAKQMLDFLVENGYRYQPGVEAGDGAPRAAAQDRLADQPLFVSVTSTGDLATKVALPIGHALPDLGFKMAGSFRNLGGEGGGAYDLACFDPHREHPYWDLRTKAEGAAAQSSFYMTTAPHMQVLQSHVMLKAVSGTQMQVASTGQKITIHNPQAIAACDRNLLNAEGLHVDRAFRLWDTQTCFAIAERPGRCNGTPYWMMEIDPDVVPDHSTIFTQRFVHFLIDTFFVTPQGERMERVAPQLMQTRGAAGN